MAPHATKERTQNQPTHDTQVKGGQQIQGNQQNQGKSGG
jgi:hypothetical protein